MLSGMGMNTTATDRIFQALDIFGYIAPRRAHSRATVKGDRPMTKPRCAKHQDRKTLPALCHICQRIAVEQDIVTRTVDVMLSAGFALASDDGAGYRPKTPTTNRATILAELMETDDEDLAVFSTDHVPANGGWVRFVYGNNGYDVISDYTTGLETVLAPVNAYADTLS